MPALAPFTGESLCPDCTEFTTEVLKPIFSSGLRQLIDFRYSTPHWLLPAGESLCPYCGELTTTVLKDIFSDGISAVANFRSENMDTPLKSHNCRKF